MKTLIITGSHRQESQSAKVGRWCQRTIESQFKDSQVEMIDLGKEKLSLWDENQFTLAEWKSQWDPMVSRLKNADSLVVVTPEWGGMVPPALKNFLLNCNGALTGNKPALIVAVTSDVGSVYPISELRMSGYKNNHLCFIPEHVIVRHCEQFLNHDLDSVAIQASISSDSSSLELNDDQRIQVRLVYALKVLEQYEKALKLVRESGVADFKRFGNGM
jgi:NAD(P)H-dependent FMN reductase